MTVIPQSKLNEWSDETGQNVKSDVAMLLEFRELLTECGEAWRKEQKVMRAYDEAAQAFRCDGETVRRNLNYIGGFDDNSIMLWIAQGLSLHHFRVAKEVQHEAKRSPADILDQAIILGNPEEARPMTVDQMREWATGEKVKQTPKYHFTADFERLFNYPNRLKWEQEKADAWNDLTHEYKERAARFFEKGNAWKR